MCYLWEWEGADPKPKEPGCSQAPEREESRPAMGVNSLWLDLKAPEMLHRLFLLEEGKCTTLKRDVTTF